MDLFYLFFCFINCEKISIEVENLTKEINSWFCDNVKVGGAKCPNTYGQQDFIDGLASYFASGVIDASIQFEESLQVVKEGINNRIQKICFSLFYVKSTFKTT